jgi:hypothetical protein
VLAFAVGAVRLWTRLYTWRMEPALRDSRRAEIESDLWEFEQDQVRTSLPALHVVFRLLNGVAADVCWRVECADPDERLQQSRFVTTGVALAVAALWILPSWFGQEGRVGRTAVFDCASAAPPPRTTPEFRLQVVTCAGAFFTPLK